MASSTKNAGLRKTKAMSCFVRAHSCARPAPVRGTGSAPMGVTGGRSGAMAPGLALPPSAPPGSAKRKRLNASVNSTPATPSHSSRLASSSPASGGSSVLRSAAVQ